MIRNKRRRVAGMAAILVVAVMTGCAGSNDPKPSAASSSASSSAAATATAGASPTQASEKEPVTLKLSSDNALFMATLAPGAQHDPVMEEIRRKTGVTLELDTQTDDKKFNLMLAGGDLPDIIVLQNAPKYLKQMIEGNQVIPLDELIEKHGQTILKESPSKIEISKRFFSNGTGSLYAIPGIASRKGPQYKYGNHAYNIRWDYYKELGFPAVNNLDDLLKLLADMQQKHPTNAQGQKVYGMAPLFDWGLVPYEMFDRLFDRINKNNLFVYLEPGTFKAAGGILDPNVAYWEGTKFYRKANEMGVLDPDSFTQKYENFTEKVKSGRVLLSPWTWAGVTEANAALAKEDPLKGWEPLPVPAGQTVYLGEFGENGFSNRLIMISKNSKHPERAMELIDYLQSFEGSRLIQNGIQGKDWDVVDGKPQWKQATIDAQKNDPNFSQNTGIGLYWNLAGFVDGYPDPEYGTPINFTNQADFWRTQMTELDQDYSKHYGVSYPGELVEKRVEAGEIRTIYYDMDNELGTDTSMPDDIKRIETKVTDYLVRMAPKLIYAATEEEYASTQAKMMDELKGMGAQKAIDYWMANMTKASETYAGLKK